MSIVGEPRPVTATSWTLRVHTMAGDTVDFPCPNSGLTRISDVKLLLAESNPAWPASRQRLMPPLRSSLVENASGDSDGTGTSQGAASGTCSANFEPLSDHCTLQACGIADGATLELLMADISWSDRNSALISEIQNAGDTIDLSRRDLDSDAAVAIEWAIVNQVWSHLHERPLRFL